MKLLKNDYPYIKTVLVFPYKHLNFIEEFYDDFEHPELGRTSSYVISETGRNWYMLSKSVCLVAYVNPHAELSHNPEKRLVKYAEKNYPNMIIKRLWYY